MCLSLCVYVYVPAIVIFSMTTLVIWGFNLNMGSLLAVMGQDPIVSALTGRYLTIFLPAMPVSASLLPRQPPSNNYMDN